MMELRVLGRTDLVTADPAAARNVLAQPRPTALLVYLAVASPGDFHRRDHLVGLFWAETDQEHARANLRKLLHTLRKVLGDALIESRGDEEIRLAPDALWCDAAEYERCLEKGWLLRAIELYKGPLLPGFFVTGAAAFHDWLDSTRRRFGREAIKGALTLAKEHASNQELTKAGDLAHFIRHLDVELEDEHQLRKLIDLLEQMGDRASALQLFERFRQRLLREYDATPSPETRALIERIKRR